VRIDHGSWQEVQQLLQQTSQEQRFDEVSEHDVM
jgi:hypothetical protein